MSRDHVGIADLTELLHDALLQGGEWDADSARLTLRFRCLRRDVERPGQDLGAVDLVLASVGAIAVSYDPLWQEERPSAFRVPDGATIERLQPWPLPEDDVDATVDFAEACDDVEDAATTSWLKGELRHLRDARHRLVLHAGHARRAGARCWITIAFEQATPRVDGVVLPWDEWANQYDAWWRAWSGAADPEDDDALAEPMAPTSYRVHEPVIDLDPNALDPELLGAVVTWFEAQHTSAEDITQLAYARSITSWWIEGRRANVVVAGVEHVPADESEPAENVVRTWSFDVRRRDAGWKVRTWTSCEADGPMPAWAARWRSGRVTLR